MTESILGSGARLWQVKRQHERQVDAQRERALADTRRDPHWQVGRLARDGMFVEALALLDKMLESGRADETQRISQKLFLSSALLAKNPRAAVEFVRKLPERFRDVRTYNMALQACASGRDINSALELLDMVDKTRVHKDVKFYTTMINVCKSAGSADRAFKYFADMRAADMPLDSRVYGALVGACAEAMQRELSVAHERKDQYVLLERALNLTDQAQAAGLHLGAPVYNSLLVCAGRSGQLGRAFEVLDRMTSCGVTPDAKTFGSLIEASVLAGRQDLALKIFSNALREGFTDQVEIYTIAVSACKIEGLTDLSVALDIYTTMQRNGVEADKKFYAALMAVAAKAGRVDLALEMLEDAASDGVTLTTTLANALMYAAQADLRLMRKVYDLCAAHKVYPQVSQFNRMMDAYVSQSRFGEVVSLACDMVAAGHAPNLNTYRILINACQRADQAQLAIEVYASMRARRIPILQKKFAQSIFFSLLKVCFNQIRHQWAAAAARERNGRPCAWAKPGGAPVLRQHEAEKLLAALRSGGGAGSSGGGAPSSSGGGHHQSAQHHGGQQHGGGLGLLLMPSESINWQQHAMMAYRDMVQAGFRPGVTVIDMLVRSLRLRLTLAQPFPPVAPGGVHPNPVHGHMHGHSDGDSGGHLTSGGGGGASTSEFGALGVMGRRGGVGGPLGGGGGAAAGPSGLGGAAQGGHAHGGPAGSMGGGGGGAGELRSAAQRYEATFDRRALSLVEDAMARGHLPSTKGVEDGPATVDLRGMPPALAELIVTSALSALEKRAARTGRCQVFHNVTFLVPPFNPDYTLWPSWLEKLNRHYDHLYAPEGGDSDTAGGSEQHAGASGARPADSSSSHEPGGSGASASSYEDDNDATSMEDEDEDVGVMDDYNAFVERTTVAAGGGDQARAEAVASAASSSVLASEAAAAPEQAAADERTGGLPLSATEAAAAMSPSSSLSAGGGQQLHEMEWQYEACSTTGLAAAATCRRLKAYCSIDAVRGTVTLESRELSRWLINRRSFEMQTQERPRAAHAGASGSSSGSGGSTGAGGSVLQYGERPGVPGVGVVGGALPSWAGRTVSAGYATSADSSATGPGSHASPPPPSTSAASADDAADAAAAASRESRHQQQHHHQQQHSGGPGTAFSTGYGGAGRRANDSGAPVFRVAPSLMRLPGAAGPPPVAGLAKVGAAGKARSAAAAAAALAAVIASGSSSDSDSYHDTAPASSKKASSSGSGNSAASGSKKVRGGAAGCASASATPSGAAPVAELGVGIVVDAPDGSGGSAGGEGAAAADSGAAVTRR